MPPDKCSHQNFHSKVEVFRLTRREGSPVEDFMAEIRIKCLDCGLPFRFLGLGFGLSFDKPRLSPDALELRAPIEPEIVPEILGLPLGQTGRA